ncbi:MAG TPA: FAD-containing oxidoreductase [Minicystis sp.]|nr:FAD-containing oxidoreductase [Minicystis sp.]
MRYDYDDVVIGAGQSGPFLAVKLAARGRRVALVEARRLGGTCVNDGCIPTKTMVASARAAWVAKNAARWGVEITGDVRVDFGAVRARKDAIVAESVTSLESWIGGTKGLELVRARARFVDPHTVEAGGRRISGERFFLNLGARPVVPPVRGLREAPHLTNEDVMDLEALPEHLVVLGGSYIGLEFAQMFRRFGSRVTVVEKAPRVVPREDEDVSEAIASILSGEGIEILAGAEVERVEHDGGGPIVHAGGRAIRGSHLLVAIGRTPSTRDVGLDTAGVALDARGFVVTDERLVTSQPHIWAIGDCNGRGAFTHTSYDDHQIVAQNLLDGADRKVTERVPIYGLFIDPPLGRCGMSAAEARASGRRVLVGRRPMARVGRARERGETAGHIQLLVDADTEQFLGATILGVEGDEVVHLVADQMYARASYRVMMRAVHAHPTVAELLPTVLESLAPLT